MKHTHLALAAALASITVISLPSLALPPGANPNPKAVEAGHYVVEPSHTRVTFGVSHLGFNDYFGEFVGASGSLVLDPKNPAASKLDVSVPTAGISTTNAKLDGELKSADWFDAAKYPTINFTSTKVTVTGPGRANVLGNLTLHGVTKPVVLTAKFNAGGVNPLSKAYTTGFHVTGKIKRSDFGVKTYVPLIGDEVSLNISAAFEKQAK